MNITEPCVDSVYFTSHKFKEEEPKVFTREETQQPHPQAINTPLEKRIVKFKVYEVNPEIGTNVEFYIDNKLQLSGYWVDIKDFQTQFKL
jgi:recombination DNA repair RAD52 pathway protein